MRELAEEGETLIDLLSRERLHLFRTKTLHSKGTHHTAVEHSALKRLRRDLGLGGQVAEETSGKGIACAGWVDDLVERQSGSAEGRRDAAVLFAKECGGAIFAVLDDQGL